MAVRIEPTKQVAVGQLPNAPQAPAQSTPKTPGNSTLVSNTTPGAAGIQTVAQ